MISLARRSIAREGALSKYMRSPFTGTSRSPWLAGHHYFHATPCHRAVQPYLLADIGEGITECRIVQWFVKPGDHVNQFDPVCEVQSDKASVEITSRYDGVIKTLHHEVDEIASVGQPLLDIDIEDSGANEGSSIPAETPAKAARGADPNLEDDIPSEKHQERVLEDVRSAERSSVDNPGRPGVAVPAVRLLLKQHGIDLSDVPGTGKGGRVTKEDVQRYLNALTTRTTQQPGPQMAGPTAFDTTVPLTPTESQMFNVMTESLSIPHLGYTHSVDLTSVNSIRKKCNARKDFASVILGKPAPKLTFLPIIIKALSMAFQHHRKLNAHLTVAGNGKHQLLLKGSHDFGIAVDTPNGLLVPVIRGVQSRSILSIAGEISRLSDLAREGKLKQADFKGATFIVSNIGSIGGRVISPIIVPPMVGIVAIGKVEEVARFVKNTEGGEEIVKRQEAMLSWSADHRVLDGASVARCAEAVSTILEEIDGVSFALM